MAAIQYLYFIYTDCNCSVCLPSIGIYYITILHYIVYKCHSPYIYEKWLRKCHKTYKHHQRVGGSRIWPKFLRIPKMLDRFATCMYICILVLCLSRLTHHYSLLIGYCGVWFEKMTQDFNFHHVSCMKEKSRFFFFFFLRRNSKLIKFPTLKLQ